jgi:hypothetical protein
MVETIEHLSFEGMDEPQRFAARVYRQLVTVRINELYYQRQAASLQVWSKTLSSVAALASSAAVVAFLQSVHPAWPAGLAGLGAIAAAVAPVLGWESKSAQAEKAAFGYTTARMRLHALMRDLLQKGVDGDHFARFAEIEAWVSGLIVFDGSPDMKLLERCQDDVEKAWPADGGYEVLV